MPQIPMYEIQASNINSIGLLTVSQYETYNPPANPANNKIPPILSGGDWWLNQSGNYSRYAYVVHNEKANPYTGAVNCNLKVRPILSLRSGIPAPTVIGDQVLFGNQTWIVITSTLVISEDAIGSSPYRNDWKATDALTYNQSTIKLFLDNWLEYWKPS